MSEQRFRKGDKVSFLYGGTRLVHGIVKEDRGPLGVKGRRLILVEFRYDLPCDEPMEIELPVDRLQLVEDAVPTE